MDTARLPSDRLDEENRLQSYIRPISGDYSPGLYGLRRQGPI